MSGLDPMLSTAELPLANEFYPLGFPLQFRTNAQELMTAAEASWGEYPKRFDRPPLRLDALAAGPGHPNGDPVWRARGAILTVVTDRGNFASADLNDGIAACWTTAAADPDWVRFHFLDGLCYSMLAHRDLTPVHAACVVSPEGRGLLLCGPSGAGKSSLTYAASLCGWTIVSDDAVFLVRAQHGFVCLGRPFRIRLRDTAVHLFPQLAGVPVVTEPNGKRTLFVPTPRFALDAEVQGIVFLQRTETQAPSMIRVDGEAAAARLLADLPRFEVHQEHEACLRRLCTRPAVELTYSNPEAALQALRKEFA